MELAGLEVVGDIALLRLRTVGIDHDQRISEVGHGLREGFQLVDVDQVGVVVDAVDQVDRERAAASRRDLVEHGGERCQAGAAGQHQHRAHDVAQVEAALGAVHDQGVARLGRSGQVAAHQAARHVADQERDLAVLGHGAEGVGAMRLGARHLQVGVLARQEGQLLDVVARHGQRDGAVGHQAHVLDGRGQAGLGGLADGRGGGNADDEIALRTHLAGQHEALLELFLGQRVVDVVAAHVELARLAAGLAGAAGAVAAVDGDVDLLAIGGISHGLAVFAVDEARDPILEIKGDFVSRHDVFSVAGWSKPGLPGEKDRRQPLRSRRRCLRIQSGPARGPDRDQRW